jgi:hypothetical protein
MPKKLNRTYKLEDGLQEQLVACLNTMLDGHVVQWKDCVQAGIIGEEERTVFAAMGWLSSRSDSRLAVVSEDVEPEKGE